MDFSRDLEQLIEARFGWFAARLVLGAFVVIILGGAVTVIVGGVTWVDGQIVPRLKGIPLPAPSSWTDIAMAFTITIVAGLVAACFAVRGFRRWERRHLEVLDAYFSERLLPRIASIEQDRDAIEKRTTALESHTDISGLKAQIARRLADRVGPELGGPGRPDGR